MKEFICRIHGETEYYLYEDGRGRRCKKCNSERVARQRRERKELLIARAGGACAVCGYCGCARALQFHHLDPTTKQFQIGYRGGCRALQKDLDEIKKCILVCANCHAEIESGLVSTAALLPVTETDEVRILGSE